MATNYPPPPPGQAPVPPEGAQPAPGYQDVPAEVVAPDEAKPGGNKMPLIIGGMVLALVLIGAAVFLLMGGEDESATSTTGGTAAPRPTGTSTANQGKPGGTGAPAQGSSTASPAPSLDPGLSADVSESYQQYSARNPFKCTFACKTSTGSTTSSGSSGSATGGTTASPSPQGGTTSGTQQSSTSSLTLSEIVRDGSAQKAIVKVNGSTYTVGTGETFAGNYKVTKISGSCASFLQGDSPFTLCTGQSVLK